MNIINDKKLSLIAKLIISYVLLLDFAFLFYVFNTDPSSDQTSRGAVFTNLLVWTATLYAPIAAYFFYDSWKEQKSYDLEREQLSNALNQLSKISTDLYKSRSDIHQISKVATQIVYVPSYLKRKEFDYVHELFTLYSFINNYSQITNNEDLIKLYNKLEKGCYNFYSTKKNILNHYKKYMKKLKEIDPSLVGSLAQCRSYDSSKSNIREEIIKITTITEEEQKYELKDKNGELLDTKKIKPYDLVNELIILTNSLIKECNTKSLP